MYAEFDLTFDRQHLERIYFGKLRASSLLSPITRGTFIRLMFMLICLLSFSYASWLTKEPVVFVFAAGFLLGGFAAYIDLMRKMKEQAKRNEEVRSYLQYIETIEKHRLIVKDEGIVLQQDGEESIAVWENFSKVRKYRDHLKLSGEIDFVIPASTMPREEYDVLKEILGERIGG